MVSELVVADELTKIEADIERDLAVAKRGREASIRIGRALRRVRDDGLHLIGYTNFESYVKERWGFSKSWAYELIAIVDGTNRDRSKIEGPKDDDVRLPDTSFLSSQSDEPTEEEPVEEAVIDVESKPATTAPPSKPEQKPEVPKGLLPAFNEAPAFTALVQQCGKIKTELARLADSPAGVFLAERMTQIGADLANLQRAIKFAKPDAICPYCKGKGCKPQDGRKAPCRGAGWVIKGVKGDGQ